MRSLIFLVFALAATPAIADPFAITAAIWASPLGAGITTAAGFYALQAAVTVGLYVAGAAASIAISKALAPDLPTSQAQTLDPGQYKNVLKTSETSEVNAIGRVRLGGVLLHGNSSGTSRYRLIAHAKGKMVRILAYYLGGREVVVEDDASVSSVPYRTDAGSYISWQTQPGTGSEIAWPGLISTFGYWTSDHRARGIAQSLLTYVSPGIYTEEFGRLYQGGEPEASLLAEFREPYDPRTGTNRYTDNGILSAVEIMRSWPKMSFERFDWADIAIEADKADELVPTLNGTEKRSRCSGVWLSESKCGDTMQQVLESIGARLTVSENGLIRIRLIDDDPAPAIAISDADGDVIGWSWRSGPEAVERPNVCRVQYYSPERQYEIAEISMAGIGWARAQDDIDRYGEKPFDVELPFCPSASQAQRIARRLFLTARGDSGVLTMNWAGMAAWGENEASITLTDPATTFKALIAPARIDDAAGEVEIPFIALPEELAQAWNPVDMEAAAPDVVPDLISNSDMEVPTAPYNVATVRYLHTGAIETRIEYVGVSNGIESEANYILYSGDTELAPKGMFEYIGNGKWYAVAGGDLRAFNVDFRVRFANADGAVSYWSPRLEARPVPPIDNTAPQAPFVSGSPANGTPNFTAQDINVVRIVAEIADIGDTNWTIHELWEGVRPGVTVELTTPFIIESDKQWRAYCVTSDGTNGAFASGSYPIP